MADNEKELSGEIPKKISPPSTPAPNPMEQDEEESTIPKLDNFTTTEKDELIHKDDNETAEDPLLPSSPSPTGSDKGKKKAVKESRSDSTDGRKKKKRRPRKKEGEEGASANRKKKRHKRRKSEDDKENSPDHDKVQLVASQQHEEEKNPYEPTVEFINKNGTQSTVIKMNEDKGYEEDEPELVEHNMRKITIYTIFAFLSTVVCFPPVGLFAILYANKSKTLFESGDIEESYKLIKRSKMFSQIASVIGFLLVVLIVILFIVSKMS